MPVDRNGRNLLEKIVLQWARKELTPLQTTEAVRALTQDGAGEQDDKGCRRIAECLGDDPQGKGFMYCRSNWKLARKWLAYLRSDLELYEYSYREEGIPQRLYAYRAYLAVVLLGLIVCVAGFGKMWLLVWPVSSVMGWIYWFGEENSKSRKKERAAYPFDSMASMEEHLALANVPPAMPTYIKPGWAKKIKVILIFPLIVVVAIPSLSLILLFVLIFSGVQGPFWLKNWTIKKYRVRIPS